MQAENITSPCTRARHAGRVVVGEDPSGGSRRHLAHRPRSRPPTAAGGAPAQRRGSPHVVDVAARPSGSPKRPSPAPSAVVVSEAAPSCKGAGLIVPRAQRTRGSPGGAMSRRSPSHIASARRRDLRGVAVRRPRSPTAESRGASGGSLRSSLPAQTAARPRGPSAALIERLMARNEGCPPERALASENAEGSEAGSSSAFSRSKRSRDIALRDATRRRGEASASPKASSPTHRDCRVVFSRAPPRASPRSRRPWRAPRRTARGPDRVFVRSAALTAAASSGPNSRPRNTVTEVRLASFALSRSTQEATPTVLPACHRGPLGAAEM